MLAKVDEDVVVVVLSSLREMRNFEVIFRNVLCVND